MKNSLAQAINFNDIYQKVVESQNIDSKKLNFFSPGEASQVGNIIDLVLPYVFIIAGLILLFFLIAGGFQLMTSPGDEKAVASAKAKIANALIGFLLLFVSYWIVQIIQTILGFQVL